VNLASLATMTEDSADGDQFDLLLGNVKQELQAQNAMRRAGFSPELINDLASGIATNIHYAFEYRLMNKWRKPPGWEPAESN
jgi:hypothetical protein